MIKKNSKYLAVLLLIIFADQGSKLWAYNYMQLVPDYHIKILGNFFKLTYVLNYGMAFGLELGFKYGKLVITFLRLFASIYLMMHIIRSLAKPTQTVCIWGWITLLGGAVGNTIDGIFYGVYLNNAPLDAPMKWFHGQVIDLIHFDFWSGLLPNWVPIWGGRELNIIPIFNIADVAIFLGLVFIAFSINSLPEPEIDDKISGVNA